MANRTILVPRATGTQGLAVCRHLHEKGFAIHGLVGDISSDRTIPLKQLGVKLFEGKEDNKEAVALAMNGCDGLFLNILPKFGTEDSEIHQTRVLLDAFKAAGASQVVCSTSIGAGRDELRGENTETSVTAKFREGKAKMQTEVQNAGVKSWTILRPGFFMSNFLWPMGSIMFPELASEHKLNSAFSPDSTLALIDPNDIGASAAAVFESPEKFAGRIEDLVSEKLTVERAVELLSGATGLPIEAIYHTQEEKKRLAKTNLIFQSQLETKKGHEIADTNGVPSLGVKPGTFENFLKREKESVQATFNANKESIKLF